MIERRNFYRLLHVQPDAPIAVIRESYRVLMASQNNHFDSTGAAWNASHLSIAYETLQNSGERAVYDRELLKRYSIKALSRGAFGSNTTPSAKNSNDRLNSSNRRNYYRILQVQPDAPDETIAVSYQVLKQDQPQHSLLLDQAYRILSNPLTRKQYDAIFAHYTQDTQDTQRSSKVDDDHSWVTMAPINHAETHAVDMHASQQAKSCLFCKTPYPSKAAPYQREICLECASPLHEIAHGNFDPSRRMLRRIHIKGEFLFYLFWPSKPYRGVIQDISPIGIRFSTDAILAPKDIIKIDAPNFQAIAEITYTHHDENGVSAGTRFMAAQFDPQQGNFVSVHA